MSGFQTIGRSGNTKLIQRVTVSVASGGGIITATASITSVNTALAEVWNLGCVYGQGNVAAPSYAVGLLNATTVVVYCNSPSSTNTVYLQVTEKLS